jgi:propanediol dehydratase small subunit
MTAKLTVADYPLAETRSDRIKGKRGKSLDDITLDSVVAGRVTMEDLRITPQALADQAEISRRRAPHSGPEF